MYININPRHEALADLKVNKVAHGIKQFFSDTDRVFIVENNYKYT